MKLPPLGFGVATSAYQVEGAVEADGRGLSTWDEFCLRPGAILDGTDGRVACDSYHRFAEDLDLLVGLGVSSYRFSIAWPRVQPDGRGRALTAGLDHYEQMVDALLDKGIRPLPTLLHWDLPLALEQAGGWPERDTARRFADYAALVVGRLGDRVSCWASLNEPWCTAFLGYAAGVFAPGRREPAAAYAAAHHLLLAHGLAAAALPDTDLGIVLNLAPVRPETSADEPAAEIVDALQNGLWLDALTKGSYPQVLVAMGAGFVQDGDLATIQGSASWIGVNYYTPFRVGAPAAATGAVGQDVEAFPGAPDFAFRPRPPLTSMGWEVDPDGLADVLWRVASCAAGVPLRVTENGAAFHESGLEDYDRIAYLQGHLAAVDRVRAAGVPVLDYVAWSLLDNFEWAQGHTQTFGLVAIEPGTLRRLPKASYRWYAQQVGARRG